MSDMTQKELDRFIALKALFVANHSGGKDSQAMLIKLLEVVPPEQILVVHASLGAMEWDGALELARDQAKDAGLNFIVAKADKTLLDMVEKRFRNRPDVPSWPSTKHRQCTSDLKRGPIEREVRRFLKRRGGPSIKSAGEEDIVVSCTGIRAQESANRAKLNPFTYNERNSHLTRAWYDWAPIHHLTTMEVFATIAAAGQTPHWAYATGNDRLSCVFCIMGSKSDIRNGKLWNPDLFKRYVSLEQRTGYTMHMSGKSLTEIVADK